jgi:hypothetical protein
VPSFNPKRRPFVFASVYLARWKGGEGAEADRFETSWPVSSDVTNDHATQLRTLARRPKVFRSMAPIDTMAIRRMAWRFPFLTPRSRATSDRRTSATGRGTSFTFGDALTQDEAVPWTNADIPSTYRLLAVALWGSEGKYSLMLAASMKACTTGGLGVSYFGRTVSRPLDSDTRINADSLGCGGSEGRSCFSSVSQWSSCDR